MCAAADAGDAALCFDLLNDAAKRAAGAAGMPLRTLRSAPPGAPRLPWFDAQCRYLRAATRRCARDFPHSEAHRALKNHYKSVTRRKRDECAVRYAVALYRELKFNPRRLYELARASPLRLPVHLLDPAQWWDFVDCLARGPEHLAVCLPPLVPNQPSAGPHAALAVPFEEATVLAALKRLPNGRSAGASGWRAELLRYGYGPAPDPNEPAPHLLAPAVTALLNCWFRTGVVPLAANCGLVVPIHKRGDVAQPSNYRPITVGEPLLRLYGALFNERLVAYTESQGLRAPSQFGFRPRLSTLHPLFTLQHFIDQYATCASHCSAAFLTSRVPMIAFLASFCGRR